MIVVIANPASGRTKSKSMRQKLSDLCHRLKAESKIELTWTKDAGDGETIARQAAASGAKLVVAAGGDGTIHEVANGLAGTSTALGLLPVGTENVLAKFLKLPLELERCFQVILAGKRRQVDL